MLQISVLGEFHILLVLFYVNSILLKGLNGETEESEIAYFSWLLLHFSQNLRCQIILR